MWSEGPKSPVLRLLVWIPAVLSPISGLVLLLNPNPHANFMGHWFWVVMCFAAPAMLAIERTWMATPGRTSLSGTIATLVILWSGVVVGICRYGLSDSLSEEVGEALALLSILVASFAVFRTLIHSRG